MAAAGNEDEITAKAYDAHLSRRLITYVHPYGGLVAAALLCIVVQAALQLAGPLLTRHLIDVAVPAGNLRLVTTIAVLFAISLGFQFAAAYGETVLTSLLGQRIMQDLRKQLFERMQRLPIAYYDRTPVGRLVTRVTSDVEALNELFTSGVVAGLGDLFTLIAISVVMLIMDWKLALAAFLVIPFVYLVSREFQKRVRTAYRDIRTRLARLNAFIAERLAGIRIVQLFGREKSELARFDHHNDGHLDAHLRSITVYALYFPVIEFLTTIALASLLMTGGYLTSTGALTVGTLAAFLQLVRRFFQPLQDLSEKYNILQSAMAASERIFALMDTPVEPDAGGHTADVDSQLERYREEGVTIEFRNVWFAYQADGGIREDAIAATGSGSVASSEAPADDNGRRERSEGSAAGQGTRSGDVRWVLRDVSFTASPGQTIALVGHTGAGKSTIVNLLMRFYEPQRGSILVNGNDIRTIPLDVLRGMIGYVQQDIFLFAGDIASNIRLASGISDDALEQAASRVGADRVILRLPSGWNHQLAERGASISVGERQLLAFARAIAADPALLVLDEATSAVDSALEEQLQRAVEELMSGRTTIAIAHRLSTIVDADEILVLHHGEVIERGTHAGLLSQNGLYDRLYRLQIGSNPGLVSGVRR